MTEQEKRVFFEKYEKRTHTLGRIVCIICLVLFLGAPFVMGLYFGVSPDFHAFLMGFLKIGVVYLVSCIAEYAIYVPMLGSGGSYLAFITGNLINMKIPCAINAKDIVGAKSGTAENEIISTLSIATSSLVTILVLAVGVLLLTPLRPILESEALQPAFENVVPALFGAMAYKYYRGNLKIAVIPLIVMTVLFLAVPSLIGSVSTMIIPSGAMAIGIAYWLYKKQQSREPV